jgi:hypothetical protein
MYNKLLLFARQVDEKISQNIHSFVGADEIYGSEDYVL